MTTRAQLHLGDALTLLPSIEAGSINAVICDLPYGTTTIDWDKTLPIDVLWAEWRRVLAPGGVVILFGNQPFTSLLITSNLKWFKQCLVWDKNKCGSPGLAKIRPMQVHEDVVVFAPGRTVYNPQMEAGEPYARQSSKPEGYVGRKNDHGYGMKPRTGFVNEGTRYPKSVIRISRDFSAQQQVHPTQKPVSLMAWLVKTYTNPGDTVLDNVMGSGSTGVACMQTGRHFVGIERNPEYFQIAQQRIEEEQK